MTTSVNVSKLPSVQSTAEFHIMAGLDGNPENLTLEESKAYYKPRCELSQTGQICDEASLTIKAEHALEMAALLQVPTTDIYMDGVSREVQGWKVYPPVRSGRADNYDLGSRLQSDIDADLDHDGILSVPEMRVSLFSQDPSIDPGRLVSETKQTVQRRIWIESEHQFLIQQTSDSGHPHMVYGTVMVALAVSGGLAHLADGANIFTAPLVGTGVVVVQTGLLATIGTAVALGAMTGLACYAPYIRIKDATTSAPTRPATQTDRLILK